MNLCTAAWIPVRHRSGKRAMIAPWQINQDVADPIEAIEAARAPWNGALTEFLIGIFQTVLLPEDAAAWRQFWVNPPSAGFLKKELEKVAELFELYGAAPFMQDLELRKSGDKYRKPIQKFLVDGVSEAQEKNRADLFMRSGEIAALCLPCAAAVLVDMQAHAPQGSAGYYTSLRGGGPSTTLILCDTLWKTVWANVGEQAAFGLKGRGDLREILPWAGGDTKHPLHVFWGMPRRVLLDQPAEGACSCCGAVGPVVKNFVSYRGGIKYLETQWRHPLSPYESKEGGWLVRPTEGDLVGYRHWMGLLVDTPNGDGVPAFTVKRWLERDLPGESVRIWGYGYACNQAAVNRWCEGKMPVVAVPAASREPFERFVRTLITLAERGREQLHSAIYCALKFSKKPTYPNRLSITLWPRTESAFLSYFRQGAADPRKETLENLVDAWLSVIQSESLTIYNEAIRAASPEWGARYGHKLRRKLSDSDPVSLKTKKYGDWRLHESA